MKPWNLRLLALLVFGVSFALPAVRLHQSQPSAPSNPIADSIPGFYCAFLANYVAPAALLQSRGEAFTTEGGMVVLGGCANLLVAAILILSLWSRLVRTRLILVAATLPCCGAAWLLFAKEHFQPLIGHYLWVAGALLFAVPELLNLLRKPAPVAAGEAEPVSLRTTAGR